MTTMTSETTETPRTCGSGHDATLPVQQVGGAHWHIAGYCVSFGWRDFGAKPQPDRGGLWFVDRDGRPTYTAGLFTAAKSWIDAQPKDGEPR